MESVYDPKYLQRIVGGKNFKSNSFLFVIKKSLWKNQFYRE